MSCPQAVLYVVMMYKKIGESPAWILFYHMHIVFASINITNLMLSYKIEVRIFLSECIILQKTRHSLVSSVSFLFFFSLRNYFFFVLFCFCFGLNAPSSRYRASSSSSRSSDGNFSLPDEGGSASQVPQAFVQLAGYGSVVWPDSLSEWLVVVGGAGLQ